MATVITGVESIRLVQMLAWRGALHLETKGLRRRGRSVLSIVKQQMCFKGGAVSVLRQLEDYLDVNGNAPLAYRYTERTPCESSKTN
jgi:hypothetical protein